MGSCQAAEVERDVTPATETDGADSQHPTNAADGNPSDGNWADFSAAFVPPPPPPPQLQAAPLTSDEVDLIKQAMSHVTLAPPPWAENLPDAEIDRMIKATLRSS